MASAPGASRPRTFSPLGTGSSTRSRSFSWLPDGGRGSAGGVQRGVASSQRGVSAADDLAESYKRQIDATSEILERERDMLERCTASPAYLRSVPIRAFLGVDSVDCRMWVMSRVDVLKCCPLWAFLPALGISFVLSCLVLSCLDLSCFPSCRRWEPGNGPGHNLEPNQSLDPRCSQPDQSPLSNAQGNQSPMSNTQGEGERKRSTHTQGPHVVTQKCWLIFNLPGVSTSCSRERPTLFSL